MERTLSTEVTAALDALGTPCLVLDSAGGLVHANPLGRKLIDGLSCSGGTLTEAVVKSVELPSTVPPSAEEARLLLEADHQPFELRVRHFVVGDASQALTLVTVFSRPGLVAEGTLMGAARSRGLTPRQAEVAALMSRRLSHREIAERLGISPHTARRHEEAVLTMLGVRRRSDVLSSLSGDEELAPAG